MATIKHGGEKVYQLQTDESEGTDAALHHKAAQPLPTLDLVSQEEVWNSFSTVEDVKRYGMYTVSAIGTMLGEFHSLPAFKSVLGWVGMAVGTVRQVQCA